MEYKTKSGHIITDAMLEILGDAIEKGDYPGESGKIIVAPIGRPPLYRNDDLVTVAFKIPRSYRDRLDAEAEKKKETRSDLLRAVLGEYFLSFPKTRKRRGAKR